MKNTTPPSVFTGSIPKHYDEYLGPMFFEPYAIEISKRFDPSAVQTALELGCGTGRVTSHLRKMLPSTARLIASDVSAEMLGVAKEKLDAADIDWQTIDSQQIPYADNSIDLVVCCFAYMFAQDKPRAFAEALRVLRPGGTLLLSTWDKLEFNGASDVFRKTVKRYLGDPLPAMYDLPTSMHDPLAIRKLLEDAGFSRIETEVVEKSSMCPTAKIASYGLVQGGSLYNEIVKRNPAWIAEIMEIVERELQQRYGDAPMVAPMRAVLACAVK
jgi:ubiquinone/menaquinone biosynthesis C-methylase UbiE